MWTITSATVQITWKQAQKIFTILIQKWTQLIIELEPWTGALPSNLTDPGPWISRLGQSSPKLHHKQHQVQMDHRKRHQAFQELQVVRQTPTPVSPPGYPPEPHPRP